MNESHNVRLVPGSERYVCPACQEAFVPDEWRMHVHACVDVTLRVLRERIAALEAEVKEKEQ